MPTIRSIRSVTALLGCIVAGCAQQPKLADPLPAVTATRGTDPGSTMDSARAVRPARATSAPGRGPITIRLRPVSVDTLRPPPLYLIDDVVLGRRSDGTVDHAAAARALQQLDPRRIEAIRVLKGDSTVKRFGPDAVSGVVIFMTIKDTSRTVPRAP